MNALSTSASSGQHSPTRKIFEIWLSKNKLNKSKQSTFKNKQGQKNTVKYT